MYQRIFEENIFREAVMRPEHYLILLSKKLNKYKNKLIKIRDNSLLCDMLTDIFKNEKIVFKYNTEITSDLGIAKGGYNLDTEEIIITCDSSLYEYVSNENYNLFLKDFHEVVGHEIIHRLQFLRDSKKDFMKCDLSTKDGIKKYLSNKKEVMSHAWQSIEIFKMMGLNESVILNIIQNPKSVENNLFVERNIIYKLYVDFFVKEANVYKLFVKYIYMYLNED